MEGKGMEGTVKWFSNKKGYGFISLEEGEDIFVHYGDIEGEGFKSLAEGDKVEFEIADSPRGKKAQNVKKV